jgi:hypothetical protein
VKGERPAVTGTSSILVAIMGNNIGYPMSAVIENPGPGTVYLGGQLVTTATGFPLVTDASITIDLVNEGVWAVATVTTTVYILRRGD